MENTKKMSGVNKNTNRLYYIDLLRILCCFAVVILHIPLPGGGWYKVDVNSWDWRFASFYAGIFRFAVPVFFMITGALFLGRKEDISIKKLYFCNIKKTVIIFFFWVFLYATYFWYYYGNDITGFASVIEIIKGIITNQYQLWFLIPLINCYMLMPILKQISKNRKILKYFIILFLIFGIGLNTISLIIGTGVKYQLINFFAPAMIVGYPGFVLLGYYVSNYNMKVSIKKTLYILGIVCMFINSGLTIYITNLKSTLYDGMLGYFKLTTTITSIAIFVYFKSKFANHKFSDRCKKVISKIADCTLGVYILHVLIINILGLLGITTSGFNQLIAIPIFAIFVFIISCTLTLILKKVPIIGKYLV